MRQYKARSLEIPFLLKMLFWTVLVGMTWQAACAQAATPVVTVMWTPPTTFVDGTPIVGAITYQLYVGASGAETKFGNPVTAPPYVITPTPKSGVTTCGKVTAIVNGVESAQSVEACGTVPFPTSNSPTTIIITIK